MDRPKKLKIKSRKRPRPRILVCTPEITELPEGMGNAANWIRAKGGGLGDISAGLIRYLHEDERFDLHVVLPKYDEQILDLGGVGYRELNHIAPTLQRRGVHLVRDSAFSTTRGVYSETDAHPRVQRAAAFQRYIINQLLDDLQPDVVHCNDWMTGLVPAAARVRGIRSVFTIHNIFTAQESPHELDRNGIDVRQYLRELYFTDFPGGFRETWYGNKVDFAASGVHAADVVNTVSPTFLEEVVGGRYDELVPPTLLDALRDKHRQNRALGILNAPNDTVDPRKARWAEPFGFDDAAEKKRQNRALFQSRMGMAIDGDIPLFLWPNRLYTQKGVELLTQLLTRPIADKIQVAVVANGDARAEDDIGELALGSNGRISRHHFTEELSELGKAGADFLLMPSLYEPCGLPQMEGPRFGTLPVVREVGGLKDTVREISPDGARGNGFVFGTHTVDAFEAAVQRAVEFQKQPADFRSGVVSRVMREAFQRHSLGQTAKQYVELYLSLIG